MHHDLYLYIHIPFCLAKCSYCDFYSLPGGDELPEYVDLLCREMLLRAAQWEPRGHARTLYLGGGTPSLLAPRHVARLVESASRCFGLDLDAEITLEANPCTLDLANLQGFRRAGVNRLSLGVQSFNDLMLARLGRRHTAAQARNAVQLARQAGFTNLGIDLIHSLPGQELQQWEADLAEAVLLKPEHISAYALSVEEETPFGQQLASGSLQVPAEDLAVQMFLTTGRLLQEAGYCHYEISNFCRAGLHSRHNQSYWHRENCLGFGAGAHSFHHTPPHGSRWRNVADLARYRQELIQGSLPERDRQELSRRDAMAEWMFLGLRLLEGVNPELFRKEFGQALAEAFPKQLHQLTERGLLHIQQGTIRLAPQAIILSNQVFLHFL